MVLGQIPHPTQQSLKGPPFPLDVDDSDMPMGCPGWMLELRIDGQIICTNYSIQGLVRILLNSQTFTRITC